MADFSPSRQNLAVAPSDTVNLSQGTCRGLYVGGAGNIAVVGLDGNVTTFSNIAVGIVHPIQALRINQTNTTATLIVALY